MMVEYWDLQWVVSLVEQKADGKVVLRAGQTAYYWAGWTAAKKGTASVVS